MTRLSEGHAATPAGAACASPEVLQELVERLSRLEAGLTAVLGRLATEKAEKAAYTTAEVAALLGKDEFTVREWCRGGRVNATKMRSGRGRHKAWVISGAEVERYRREGLLPLPKRGGR